MYTLNLSDLIAALADGNGPFDELRAAVVERIRQAPFYRDEDVVLRSMVDAMDQAPDVTELDSHLDVFLTWARDDERVQVITLPTNLYFGDD